MTTKEKPQKVKIAEISIARHEIGVEIKIKSKTIEEFMKSVYGNDTLNCEALWGTGERFYKRRSGTENPIMESARHTITLDGIGQNELIDSSEMLNLSFMRVAGISEGKSFKFRGLFRESDIAAIAQSMNESLKNMFKEYNTPTCYEIEVIAEK